MILGRLFLSMDPPVFCIVRGMSVSACVANMHLPQMIKGTRELH